MAVWRLKSIPRLVTDSASWDRLFEAPKGRSQTTKLLVAGAIADGVGFAKARSRASSDMDRSLNLWGLNSCIREFGNLFRRGDMRRLC
jgi:hypothetical protein